MGRVPAVGRGQSRAIEAFVDKMNCMVCDVNQQEFDDLLDSPLLDKLMTLWSDFLEHPPQQWRAINLLNVLH